MFTLPRGRGSTDRGKYTCTVYTNPLDLHPNPGLVNPIVYIKQRGRDTCLLCQGVGDPGIGESIHVQCTLTLWICTQIQG